MPFYAHNIFLIKVIDYVFYLNIIKDLNKMCMHSLICNVLPIYL